MNAAVLVGFVVAVAAVCVVVAVGCVWPVPVCTVARSSLPSG